MDTNSKAPEAPEDAPVNAAIPRGPWEDPKTRTGKARAAMADALRADFDDVHAALSTAIQLAEDLATESGGVNGVAIWWRGVGQKLAHERKSLEQKIEEVVNSLSTFKTHVPESSTDEELMERVRQARSGSEQAA